MEIYIAVIGIGLIALLNVKALRLLDQTIKKSINHLGEYVNEISDDLGEYINETSDVLYDTVEAQHKKTRKDIQETKTRLTQVRKDLNKIERKKK